jgi:DNA-binding transcriptional ArsR family regulator
VTLRRDPCAIAGGHTKGVTVMNGRQYPIVGPDGLALQDLLALLGGSIRLEVLRCLAEGPRAVSSLADALDLSIGLVSHNLRLLRDQGLVQAERCSRQRIYSLGEAIETRRLGNVIELVITVPDGDSIRLRTRPIPGPAASIDHDAVEHIDGGAVISTVGKITPDDMPRVNLGT